MTETSTVLDLLGGTSAFEAFHAENASGRYRFPGRHRVLDDEMEEVAAVVLLKLGCAADEVKSLPKAKRDERLAALRDAGLTVKQIERLTGIGSKTITRATAR